MEILLYQKDLITTTSGLGTILDHSQEEDKVYEDPDFFKNGCLEESQTRPLLHLQQGAGSALYCDVVIK